MEFFKPLQTLASGRMGAAMNDLKRLFAANEFEQGNQRCVGWNGLPFAHDALRVDNFTRQHGATVHGELQNVNHFFAAIHFHVRACGHKESASLRLLRRSVIEQAPERSNGASSFNRAVIDINNAGIGGGNFLPFSLGGKRCQQHKQTGCHSHSEFRSGRQTLCGRRIFKKMGLGIHAPYYKVVH